VNRPLRTLSQPLPQTRDYLPLGDFSIGIRFVTHDPRSAQKKGEPGYMAFDEADSDLFTVSQWARIPLQSMALDHFSELF
jgi:hypothetical protein